MSSNFRVAYTGKGDTIRIWTSEGTVSVPFYEFRRALTVLGEDLEGLIPPCPTCGATGETSDEEGRALWRCETCDGSRVRP